MISSILAERLRRQVQQASRRSREYGTRQETAFPVRPETATDIDLRKGAVVREQTTDFLPGIDMTT
jgi:hypothetical protein